MISNFVMSERARGAGRNLFSPKIGEIRYSLLVRSRSWDEGPEDWIGENVEIGSNLDIGT